MEGKSYLPKKEAIKKSNNIDENKRKDNNNITTNIDEKKENKSLSFTLKNKLNFNDKKIITIKELSNNRIGILFVHLLSIYSSKTFKKIMK